MAYRSNNALTKKSRYVGKRAFSLGRQSTAADKPLCRVLPLVKKPNVRVTKMAGILSAYVLFRKKGTLKKNALYTSALPRVIVATSNFGNCLAIKRDLFSGKRERRWQP
jgi:hypothetical protein